MHNDIVVKTTLRSINYRKYENDHKNTFWPKSPHTLFQKLEGKPFFFQSFFSSSNQCSVFPFLTQITKNIFFKNKCLRNVIWIYNDAREFSVCTLVQEVRGCQARIVNTGAYMWEGVVWKLSNFGVRTLWMFPDVMILHYIAHYDLKAKQYIFRWRRKEIIIIWVYCIGFMI